MHVLERAVDARSNRDHFADARPELVVRRVQAGGLCSAELGHGGRQGGAEWGEDGRGSREVEMDAT